MGKGTQALEPSSTAIAEAEQEAGLEVEQKRLKPAATGYSGVGDINLLWHNTSPYQCFIYAYPFDKILPKVSGRKILFFS